RDFLDYTLVPSGLLILGAYHAWLLHCIVHHSSTTVIGLNAINRRFWVRAMMQQDSKNGIVAVQTLRNNIMASTVLASTAILLSSLIAVLMSNNDGGNSAGRVDFGNRSLLGLSIKFFCILVCFLGGFLLTVQSIRYYSHVSILINVPVDQRCRSHRLYVEYVGRTLNKASYFWSMGLRAFYFSFPLFLWIFGPIPMFISCPILVLLLYFLDFTFEKDQGKVEVEEEEEKEQNNK
ncbi:hypothetical protein NMG60_11017898, partial [Bertholletia excelsa]